MMTDQEYKKRIDQIMEEQYEKECKMQSEIDCLKNKLCEKEISNITARKVSVLGTEYEIIRETLEEDKAYKECDGYCDHYNKRIHVRKHTHEDSDRDDMTIDDDAMRIYENKNLRHELTHAFMYESGLSVNSHNVNAWATSEEMIDWMAIQMPKIMEAYESIIESNKVQVSNTKTGRVFDCIG